MKKTITLFAIVMLCGATLTMSAQDRQANKEMKKEQKEMKKEEKASKKGGGGVQVSGKKGGGMDINKKGLNIKSKHGNGVRIGKGQ